MLKKRMTGIPDPKQGLEAGSGCERTPPRWRIVRAFVRQAWAGGAEQGSSAAVPTLPLLSPTRHTPFSTIEVTVSQTHPLTGKLSNGLVLNIKCPWISPLP